MRKEAERDAARSPPPAASRRPAGDIRRGFVYKRVPHVTLKSIANNPDIHEGMTREEIDTAIARHADTELLFDQPYEDRKRIRVTGPFTVESLSPHRVLSTDEERPASEADAQRSPRAVPFETMILDNLRKAGVQNTRKQERLVFDRLEPMRRRLGSRARGVRRCATRSSGASPSRSVPSTAPSGRSTSGRPPRKPSRASATTCSSSAASPSTRTSPKRRNATAA